MKLTNLRALVEKMTPEPWRLELGSVDGGAHVVTAAPVEDSWTKAPLLISHLHYPKEAVDFKGIVELRNHASQLMVIATASLAYRSANCSTVGGCVGGHHDVLCAINVARKAWLVALSTTEE